MTIAADVLIVMARYPTVGTVKTRLAARFGAAPTLALYRAFLSDLEERLRGLDATVLWAHTPDEADFAPLLRYPAACRPQGAGDLGQRMHGAVASAFAGGARRVAVIGTDAPHLDVATIRYALACPDRARVLFGPAQDGGYYLISLGAPHDVFSGMAWSTADVLAQSRARATSLGLSSELLASTFDVDDAADLSALAALLATRPSDFLPATRAALRAFPPAQRRAEPSLTGAA